MNFGAKARIFVRLVPLKKPARVCTLTAVLFSINGILAIALIDGLIRNNFQLENDQYYDAYHDKSRTNVDNYQRLVDRSMEIFDYVRKQKAGLLPKNQDFKIETILPVWCWSWFKPKKPSKSQINHSANVRQALGGPGVEIYLLSAYYDTRSVKRVPEANAFIRILGMSWRTLQNIDLFCYVWYSDDRIFIVKAMILQIWERYWDPRDSFYVPYLFACPLTADAHAYGLPNEVSVSLEFCSTNITTLLPLNYVPMKGPRKHTVVCVKGMDFLDDLSLRFVEWLEANYLFGADKIVVYTYAVHPRMQQLIDYYNNRRFSTQSSQMFASRNDAYVYSEVQKETISSGRTGSSYVTDRHFASIPITLPGRMPNFDPRVRSAYIQSNRQQKRRNELIPYNDCFYRHLYTHENVLIMDIDELAVPLEPYETWPEVLDAVKASQRGGYSKFTAFSLINAFFFDNLTKFSDSTSSYPRSFHILNHDVRSKRLSPKGLYGKSFVQIDNVLTVFNHYALHKLDRSDQLRPTIYVPPEIAQKNHYKATCPIESKDECPYLYAKTVKDHSLDRFAQIISQNVLRVLKDLNWNL